jgi:glycosyltransferase involved in cell wall biosynthesis
VSRAAEPRKLLLVIPSGMIGGAERQTMQLARRWAAEGAEVLVASEPALHDALAPLAGGARLLGAALGPASAPLSRAAHDDQAAALRPLLLRHRPDAALVALPWPNAGLGAMRACVTLGLPVLGHAHLVPRSWSLGGADRSVLAGLAGRVGWSAVAEPTARRLETLFGLEWGAAAVVANGLADPGPTRVDRAARRAALGVPEGARLVLMIGRLDERKGAALAPAIAERIAPDVLALAGEGPLREALARCSPPLRLLGQVSDARTWLAAADALLLPSRHEGCPLVLLEAAAESCPILASAEALEAWPDPRFATIVPRDPAAIALALRRPPAPESLAAGRAMVHAWDEAAMAGRLGWLLAREVARCLA